MTTNEEFANGIASTGLGQGIPNGGIGHGATCPANTENKKKPVMRFQDFYKKKKEKDANK